MKVKKVYKDILKFIFFLGIGVFLIWWFVRKLTPQEIDEIFAALKNVNYWWLLLGIFFGILSNVARTSRWITLIEPMGYKLRYHNVFMSVLIAYLANLAVPRLGELTRCGTLAKYEKVPFEKSFGTVIAERACDLIVFGILFVLNIAIQFNNLREYVNEKILGRISTDAVVEKGSSPVLWIVVGVIVLLCVAVVVFVKCLPDNKISIKIKSLIKGLFDGLKSIIHLKRPFTFIFHSLLLWGCYLMMTFAAFKALPDTALLGMDAAMSSLVFSTIGVILVQGGIGIYPIIVAEVLTVYGITSAIGYTMGWIIWTNQTVIVILGGILSLFILPLVNKQKYDANEPTSVTQ
ncbi:MAG: lysylphosphatidylglycerol synthase transmembrane domain-containing protein [Bacteroidales bacterium]|nr:lysylphosphatidylglycerol synthase transmembrane domain-containing protein [Bacteroidales bacterium]